MKRVVWLLAGLLAAMMVAAPATAQGVRTYALAVSETESLGGVIHYAIRQDGTLDGRFTYHAGNGWIDTETATPRRRGRGLAGVYDTRGISNGAAYASVLTITKLGKGPGGAEIFELRWDSGERGIAVTRTTGLIVAFGGDEAGLLSELEPGHWALAVMGWNGETPRLMGYEWRASGLAGRHDAKPMFGDTNGIIDIERVGDVHRLKLPGGAVGVAISAIR